MPPCLALSTIKWRSRIKWSNPCNEVVTSPIPQCHSYWKRELLGHPQLRSPTLLTREQDILGICGEVRTNLLATFSYRFLLMDRLVLACFHQLCVDAGCHVDLPREMTDKDRLWECQRNPCCWHALMRSLR